MSLLKGNTVLERKACLASLVAAHLITIGETATVVKDRKNSQGHTDRVVVESSIGLVHLTASNSKEPNASIPTADFIDKDQAFLADKAFVAYGWNTKDKRTIIMVVPTQDVVGHNALSKTQIRQVSFSKYSTVLPGPQA